MKMPVNKNDIVRIIFDTPLPTNAEHPYFQLNEEATHIAMQKLKKNGFKLWVYLVKSCRGMTSWVFYRSAASEYTGITANTVDNAKKELINCGYLTNPSGDGKTFIFHELPVVSQVESSEKLEVSSSETAKAHIPEERFYGF